MATITITGVDPQIKRDLTVACARAGTTVSKELRDRLEQVQIELDQGKGAIVPMLDAAMEHNEELKAQLVAYKRLVRAIPEEVIREATERIKAEARDGVR